MLTKEQAARDLAEAHYSMDRSVRQIYRPVSDHEDVPLEPVKLLEVNEDTLPAGIVPLYFAPIPNQGVAFPFVVMDITPDEFEMLERGELQLPHGWRLSVALPRPLLVERSCVPQGAVRRHQPLDHGPRSVMWGCR